MVILHTYTCMYMHTHKISRQITAFIPPMCSTTALVYLSQMLFLYMFTITSPFCHNCEIFKI